MLSAIFTKLYFKATLPASANLIYKGSLNLAFYIFS